MSPILAHFVGVLSAADDRIHRFPFRFYQRRYSASYAPAAVKHEPILHREYATMLTRRFVENADLQLRVESIPAAVRVGSPDEFGYYRIRTGVLSGVKEAPRAAENLG